MPGVMGAGPSWNTTFGLGKPSVWQVNFTLLSFSRHEASGSSTTSRVRPVIVVFVGTEVRHENNRESYNIPNLHIHTHTWDRDVGLGESS